MSARRLLVCLSFFSLAIPATQPAQAAPDNFVGVNTHVPAVDVLDAAKDSGMSWIRIDFNWHIVQPNAGKAPDFKLFDSVVAGAQKRGLKVFATIGYAPGWAADPDTDGKPFNNTPKPGLFRVFTEQAAKHFQGKITHWGLWNEPNLGQFFEGTMQQWIDRVIIEGMKGIRAGCPACKVLGPELASVGNSDETWLTAVFQALKKANMMFDAITHHIYGGFVELTPNWACWDGDLFFHDLDERRNCFGVPLGTAPLWEIMKKEQLTNVPVWITETGYRAVVGSGEEAKQTTYYRRVLEEQLKRPWWTHTFFYEIVDDNNWSEKWGISTKKAGGGPFAYPADYTLKQVFAFLKKVLGSQPAFGGNGADCDDGLDNDGDGKIDFPADPQCISAGHKSEGNATPPPADAGPPADVGIAQDSGPAPFDSTSPQADSVLPPSDGAGPPSDAAKAADGPKASADAATTPGSSSDGCAVGRGGGTAPTTAPLLLLGLLLAIRKSRARGRSGRRRATRGRPAP